MKIVLSGRRCVSITVGAVFIIFLSRADAGIVTAASAAFADVSAAVSLANDGDTVVIPSGTASWTSSLQITKAITIQGATTISGDHTTFNAATPTPMTANDQTIILDDVPRGGFGAELFYFTNAAGTSRLTGVTLRHGSVGGAAQNGAVIAGIRSDNTTARLRVDHVHFDRLANDYFGTNVGGATRGVMDHCLLDFTDAAYAVGRGFVFSMLNWGGQSYGDGAWTAPTDFGGESFFFVEDCVVNNAAGTAQTIGGTDSEGAGKYVFRYCRLINTVVTDHGTASSGHLRSVRAKEIYNNIFYFNRISGSGGLQRGGCAVIHDNTYTSVSPGSVTGITLEDYRTFDSSAIWGGANGNNGWDLNADTSDHTGNGIGGGPNGLTASGTVASLVNGLVPAGTSGTITVSGNPWTAHQFKLPSPPDGTGYSLSVVGGRNTWIIDNTSNTITFYFDYSDPNEPNGNFTVNPGNTYNIYKLPTAVLDQCGRGQGTLINYSTPAWPSEALEPVYSWNNMLNGFNVDLGSATPTIILNRDYYNRTAKPGYTPYTYPHPLVSGGGSVPTPPANLHVMGP